jgi:L-iditol 2-dehydrogenase
MATPPHDGAFTEYVSWPADFAYELPDDVSLTEGALCEPLSVGIHACRRGSVGTGDTVLVTGAGPIGLMILEAARAAGATDVILTDVVDEKLAFARERGADLAVNVAEEELEDAIDDYTDGVGVDVVVEASGAVSSIQSTLDVVSRGGTVVLVGLASEATVPFDVLEIIDNEIDVLGSFRYKNTYPAAIDLLSDEVVDVEGIVEFEASLDEIDDAFQRAMDPNVVKGMVTLDSRAGRS